MRQSIRSSTGQSNFCGQGNRAGHGTPAISRSMAKPKAPLADRSAVKVVATNRAAHHDYAIDERFEAGIALLGTEVK